MGGVGWCYFNFCIVAIIACLYDYTKKAPASFPFLDNLGAEFFTNLILYCETFSGEGSEKDACKCS